MNRRSLIQAGLATAMAGLIVPTRRARAVPPPPDTALNIVSRTIDVNGRAARVFGLMGPNGTHGLRLRADERFYVAAVNQLTEPTLLHWHGLTPPFADDGVPGLTGPMQDPNTARIYNFPVGKGGTHWMHAHTLQEQNLLAAPLIVRTASDLAADEQEVVILLHDFSFTPAAELLAKLQTGDGGHPGMNHSTSNRPATDHSGMNHAPTPHSSAHDAMPDMDLNDIAFDAYLANDRTINDPEIVRIERNARVRLRIINGASATAFTIDTGAHDAQVIAVDGQDVIPFTTRQFPLGMGQRVDLRLELRDVGDAYILARREGAHEVTGILLSSGAGQTRRRAIRVQQPERGPVLDLAMENRLRAAHPLATRPANRTFTVKLTGTMAGYHWGMESDAPLRIARNDRVEITLRNPTMMAHPMHLHGHHFQVVAINGQRIAGAMRDTVNIPPNASVTIAFDADNPGKWAFHCHHLYHMVAGMMTTIDYENT